MEEELILEEQTVALRKESVDRNVFSWAARARVAQVALRKESVDRNAAAYPHGAQLLRRSPQGERG